MRYWLTCDSNRCSRKSRGPVKYGKGRGLVSIRFRPFASEETTNVVVCGSVTQTTIAWKEVDQLFRSVMVRENSSFERHQSHRQKAWQQSHQPRLSTPRRIIRSLTCSRGKQPSWPFSDQEERQPCWHCWGPPDKSRRSSKWRKSYQYSSSISLEDTHIIWSLTLSTSTRLRKKDQLLPQAAGIPWRERIYLPSLHSWVGKDE